MQRAGELESGHTEILLGVAPAFALLVQLTLGAVLEGVVAVAYKQQSSERGLWNLPRKRNEPMSLKKWICSFLAKRAAPMLCTGASPHRCASCQSRRTVALQPAQFLTS